MIKRVSTPHSPAHGSYLRRLERGRGWINGSTQQTRNFIPFAHPIMVESLFRRYLGGDKNHAAIAAGSIPVRPAAIAAWFLSPPR